MDKNDKRIWNCLIAAAVICLVFCGFLSYKITKYAKPVEYKRYTITIGDKTFKHCIVSCDEKDMPGWVKWQEEK